MFLFFSVLDLHPKALCIFKLKFIIVIHFFRSIHIVLVDKDPAFLGNISPLHWLHSLIKKIDKLHDLNLKVNGLRAQITGKHK